MIDYNNTDVTRSDASYCLYMLIVNCKQLNYPLKLNFIDF